MSPTTGAHPERPRAAPGEGVLQRAARFAGGVAWAAAAVVAGTAAAQTPPGAPPAAPAPAAPAAGLPAMPPDTVPAPPSGDPATPSSVPGARPSDPAASPATPPAASPAASPAEPAAPAQAPAVQAPVDAPVPPADPRVVFRVTMPDGRLVLVAEGDQEPRSVGSYSVRLYGGGPAATATDRFIAGLVHPRDGGVERVVVEDLDRDGRADLVVVTRAAGTGGFLSADAYSFASNRMVRRASIGSVPPDADIVRMLAPRVKRATAP